MGEDALAGGDLDEMAEEAGTTEELMQAALAGIDLPFRLTGPNSTEALIEVLDGLRPSGIPISQSLLEVAGPFPVAGPAWWTDDWHACRDGCTRFHEGLDIFAPRFTPLVAAADGIVTQKGVGITAGLFVEIQDEAGVQYFYAHLQDWAEVDVGQSVETGDVLGYVGNSGNAISTPTHVHFEFQPGGVPAPPKPQVDAWVELALRRAEAYVYVEDVLGPPPKPTAGSPMARYVDASAAEPNLPVDSTSSFPADWVEADSCGPTLETSRVEQMAWEMEWLRQQTADTSDASTELKQLAVYHRLRWLDCWMDVAAEGAVGVAGH